ncbi:MAG: LCP family protein [Hamadaea sp.]|uniref:LCP family protein n=1 Tax=Hamadaea sp. TaxID=2024425 RepID=UPI00182F5A9D|nr:LCP family protein [Hamadaea sp.]NUR72228.1 LCP family protein [Hamadaea sp.]NUT17659.1 LCP family protein [Hamadaea sp.]
MIHRYDSSVTRGDLLSAVSRPDETGVDPRVRFRQTVRGPLNFLLIGSDKRAWSPDAGERSDTIIIAQVNQDLTKVSLISIPRDLLVDIPANRALGFEGGSDKINAAFSYGHGGDTGVQLLSATLTRLTGVKFNGAAIIEFSGFRKVIDLLGGVDLCVDHAVQSIHTGKHFKVGCVRMNGADALDYSRQRYGLPDGDYDRQRHQQQLLKAIFQRAGDSGLAYNPLKLDQLIRAVGSTLTVDTGGVSLTDLMFGLRRLGPDDLTGIKVPSYPDMVGDVSYVFLSGEAPSLFTALRAADLPTWVTAHPKWVNPL